MAEVLGPSGLGIKDISSLRSRTADTAYQAQHCFQNRPGTIHPLTFINHSKRVTNKDFVPTYGFLGSSGAPRKLIEKIVTQEGEWIYPQYKAFNPYDRKHTSAQFNKGMEHRLGPLIEASDWSYRIARKDGMNEHRIPHIVYVVTETGLLIDLGGYDEETKRNAEIAAWSHDTGGILSREAHAYISPSILLRTLPHLSSDPRRWGKISRAIIWHDSTALSPFINYMKEKGFSPPEISQALGRTMGPEGAALYIADKLDVTARRVILDKRNTRALQIVKSDPHKLVNVLLHTENAGFSSEDKTSRKAFEWGLVLDPYLPAESVHTLRPLVDVKREDRGKRKVPLIAELADMINKDPLGALLQIAHDFDEIYPTRLTEMPFVVFSLYPDIDEFKISISVATDEKKIKDKIIFIIDRQGNVSQRVERDKFRNIA